MKKHYNKRLEYLLSNNPEEVLSIPGVKIRKLFNPLFRTLLPLTTKNKLIVERKARFPKKKKIIFVGTHGFRDDIALTLKTTGTHAYLLFASLPDFFYSIDGYALNIQGVLLMNRKDPASRKAAGPKIDRAIDLVSRVVILSEGVWNKSPNLLVLKLFPGAYDEAVKKDALILPIATIIEGNKCYSKAGDAYDITLMNTADYLEIMNRIGENLKKMIDLTIYPDEAMKNLKEQLIQLLEMHHQSMLKIKNRIDKLDNFYKKNTYDLENRLKVIVDDFQAKLSQLYEDYSHLLLEEKQEKLKEEYTYNSDLMISIRKRVLHLLKTTRNMKRKVALEQLRDKMAALKLELMEEHSQAKRSDFSSYQPISTYWDEYLENLIATANGLYDYEIENTAHFVDKDEFSQEEVFEPITKINDQIKAKSKRLVLTGKENRMILN